MYKSHKFRYLDWNILLYEGYSENMQDPPYHRGPLNRLLKAAQ